MTLNRTFRFDFRSIFLCVAVLTATVQAFWSDCDLVTIANSKNGIIVTGLKVTRFNRTANSISGTAELTADLNDDYDCELKAYYSSNGNTKYTLLPYKIARNSCCSLMDSVYWKLSMDDLFQKTSDLPKRNDNEKYCFSLKERVYEARQFPFDQSVIPKFMEAGSYKIELLVYEKDASDISSRVAFIVRLY